MRLIVPLFMILLGLVHIGNAQNFDHIWLSGYNSFTSDSIFGGTVMDFSEDSFELYREDRPMNFYATNGLICDSIGHLQFYSNGIYIANVEHDTMLNGGEINPGWAADWWTAQANSGYGFPDGMFVLPRFKSEKVYDIYHISVTEKEIDVNTVDPNAVLHSIVDMGGDGGLGEVVDKNIAIYKNDTDRLSQAHFNATQHANGRDWWLVNLESQSGDLVLHLITPDTVIRMPNQASVSTLDAGLGQCSFSPDGTKFASGHVRFSNNVYTPGLNYYTFNRCSGVFEPIFYEQRSDIGQSVDGVAFSPSGRYLFEFYMNFIFRYDTEAVDVLGTKDTIAEWDGFIYYSPGGIGLKVRFGYGELGWDGNIYSNSSNSTNFIHQIKYPDVPEQTEVIQHIQIPTFNYNTIPNFPNYRLGPLEGSPCAEMFGPPIAVYSKQISEKVVSFTDASTGVPLTWHWDFGDGNTSDEQDPVYIYEKEGVYKVCLTVGNVFGPDTACHDIDVSTTGIIIPGDERVSVSINPNPVSGWLTVKVPGGSGIVRILDATGSILGEYSLWSGISEVNTVVLPAGLALVQYVDEQGWTSWSKVMILH